MYVCVCVRAPLSVGVKTEYNSKIILLTILCFSSHFIFHINIA